MTGTNQKLRQALQAISHIDDTTNHSVDASAALDRIGQIARQALALPTADHLPDAGKMVKTAAPVGERAKFEAWKKTMQDGFNEWDAWQARAALSAGDAVDAQRYRWLADCLNYPEAVTLISDGSLTADALGKAIDAAMRKESE